MLQAFDLDRFNNLSTPEKIEFSDPESLIRSVTSINTRIVNKSFNAVIQNPDENSYVRKNFISAFSSLVFLDKLKERQIYTLLIDDWESSGNVFLENQRLKELLHFYNPYSDTKEDIESVYIDCLESDETEIIGECLYGLGLISFQKALVAENSEELLLFLNKSSQYFYDCKGIVENRVDAKFLLNLVFILKELLEKKWSSSSHLILQSSNLLFKYEVFSLGSINDNIQYRLYLMLKALQNIYNLKPEEWIDFKYELDNLFINYSAIVNEKIALKLCFTTKLLGDTLKETVLKPYFVSNLSTELTRVNRLLRSETVGSEKYEFLCYLKETVENNIKKKEDILDLKRELAQLFPDNKEMTSSLAENIKTPIDAIHAFEKLSDQSKSLLESVLYASKKLQGDITFKRAGVDENARNRDIAKTLEARGFYIKDQPEWASSPTGKNSGEIDIFIINSNGTPKSIIEALNLDSLKKDYLILHLDKTFSYDVTGLKENFIITYSMALSFESLWNKYVPFIKAHSYQYQLIEFEEFDHNSTDIRLGRAKHIRNGQEIFLYHIIINMYESPLPLNVG